MAYEFKRDLQSMEVVLRSREKIHPQLGPDGRFALSTLLGSVAMTERLMRSDAIPHSLLQLLQFGKPVLLLPRKHHLFVYSDFKDPLLPGSNATSPTSRSKIASSSWAIQAARISQRH